ncbi:MAG TPA: hypothetical protein PK417_09530 [Hyphomonas sp.]|nr:hypothetical protein [Hyphomonas sp.]HRX72709.1 hypothetical protein [Hyphomonas sp.]
MDVETKRTVPASNAHTELAQDLTDLMEGKRKPFVPTKLSLPQARSLGSDEVLELRLERFATISQLKAILKKWEKHTEFKKSGIEQEVRQRLLMLLANTNEPHPMPMK